MSDLLKNGISITVSTDSLESKIDAVTGKFIKTLSKSQRSLGMSIDQMGRFVNANGKLVEGLSQAQIKLGQYVDAEGKLHTSNGGLVADLNKIEQALGFYADEMGIVRNEQHEFIRLTAEAQKQIAENKAAFEKAAKAKADAAEKEAKKIIEEERKKQEATEKSRRLDNEARQRAIQMFGQALGSASQLSGQFASLLASIECTDDEMSGFRSTFIQTAEAASAGLGTFQSVLLGFNSISEAFPSLRAGLASILRTAPAASVGLTGVGTAAATASVGVKALQLACGPVGALIAAVGAGLLAFTTTGHETAEASDEISESFKKIEERAQAAGDKIRGLNDVLKHGAFAKEDSPLDAAQDKIDAAKKSFDKTMGGKSGTLGGQAVEYYHQAGWSIDQIADFAKVGSNKKERDAIDEATEQYKKALDQYDSIASDLIDKIREEQTTEEQKAEVSKEQYRKLLEHAKTSEDRAAIEWKLKSIDEDLAESKRKELEDQKNRLSKDLGISFDFSSMRSQEKRFAADLGKLRESFEESPDLFGGVKGALKEAEKRIRQKYSSESLASFSDALSKIKPNDESDVSEENDPRKKLGELTADLKTKLEKGLISQDDYNAATQAAAEKERELLDARVAAIPGLKELLDANKEAKEAVDRHSKAVRAAEGYLKGDGTAPEAIFSNEQIDLLKDNPTGILDDAAAEYASAMEAASKALEEELIDSDSYRELVDRANASLAKATDDAAKKLRDDARAELGIDSIMESLKTPAEKFEEQMEKARQALEANQITQKEFDAFRDKLENETNEQQNELKQRQTKFENQKDATSSKVEAAKSMEAGSTALYLAQVRNSTAQYQKQIQTTTKEMRDAQLDALDESRATNYYLSEMLAAASSSYPVWG